MADQVPGIPVGTLVHEARIDPLVGGPSATERFAFGDAAVVLGPSGTVIVTEAGDGPDRGCVWNAEEVRLVGRAPAPVAERLLGAPDSDTAALPVHLMVRLDEGLLYLGTGRLGQAETVLPRDGTGHQHVLTRCLLRPDVPLSRAVLDRVRPVRPAADLPDLGWLQEVNGDRAAALERFVTGWYPAARRPAAARRPPRPSAAPEPSRPPLPRGLRQLYRLARERPDVLGTQNRIEREDELRTDHLGDLLVFGVENQGGFTWGLRWPLGDPAADPTVWFREFDEPPTAEQEPLSGFLLQYCLHEAALGAAYVALSGGLTAQQVKQLTDPLRPVPLRPFLPRAAIRFHVAPGLVLHVSRGWAEGEFQVWAGATHRCALRPLLGAGVEWRQFDG